MDSHATAFGVHNRKMAMWVFIASECMFFGSLIATYLSYEGKSLVGPTPHEILNIPLTSVSTFVLLMSSLAMVLALDAVQSGNRRMARVWLLGVIVLGGLFLGGQVFEFSHFYRAAPLVSQRPEAWTQMTLISYGLDHANEALQDVKEGRVLKALIRPQQGPH